MISVILVQYNHADLTRRAVESLRKSNRGTFEVIVVDNGSTEPGACEAAQHLKGCRVVVSPLNAGFGGANNLGARESNGDLMFFLNNDTVVRTEILPEIESYFGSHPSCGAAGPRLLNPDGSLQTSTGTFPTVISEWHTKSGRLPAREPGTPLPDWVSGAALVVRRGVFERAGGFDERYFMYFEDVDLCRRIRNDGYEVHYIPSVSVEHLGGGSQDGGLSPHMQQEYRRSQLLYYTLHGSRANNFFLRAYLFARFLPGLVAGSHARRAVASTVLSTLFRPPDERRH
jgi:GT2 family glycosyltransferase